MLSISKKIGEYPRLNDRYFKGKGKEARNEWQRRGNRSGAQSRQSAKLFLQSSKLGLPHPLTRKQVRGWGSPSSDEGTYTVVLYTYARKQGQETRKQGREVRN
jgi:hypothetical protein